MRKHGLLWGETNPVNRSEQNFLFYISKLAQPSELRQICHQMDHQYEPTGPRKPEKAMRFYLWDPQPHREQHMVENAGNTTLPPGEGARDQPGDDNNPLKPSCSISWQSNIGPPLSRCQPTKMPPTSSCGTGWLGW